MGKLWFLVYNLVTPLLLAGFWASSFFNKKSRQTLADRKGQMKGLAGYLEEIPPGRRRIWIHCVSVGEWLQALPLIKRLKESPVPPAILVSFFSPSGYHYFDTDPAVDYKFYLPLDFYWSARKVFKIIQPDLWIISKFDLWPNHLFWAGKTQTPTVLIAATLSMNSRRIQGPVGSLNKYVYRNFHWLFPISDPDRDRFLSLFPYPHRMIVTGDTRFDSVFQKSEKVIAASPRPIFRSAPDVTFLAGSIWPSDEERLFPAIRNMLLKYPGLKVVLVPHELDEKGLSKTEQYFGEIFKTERFSSFSATGSTNCRVAIIDTIGMLAGLYLNCDLAYVGGSFGVGVHNVMEPAVFGKPVLFGPNHLNSFEALELKRLGGGFEVKDQPELERQLDILIPNIELRTTAGDKARGLVMDNLGAADKILQKLKAEYDFIS